LEDRGGRWAPPFRCPTEILALAPRKLKRLDLFCLHAVTATLARKEDAMNRRALCLSILALLALALPASAVERIVLLEKFTNTA